MTAGLIAVVAAQPALDVHLVAQRGYFGVSPPKFAPEICDHAEALGMLAVEGYRVVLIGSEISARFNCGRA